MPPATRSQTAFREARATSDAPPNTDSITASSEIGFDETDYDNRDNAWTSGMRMRQDASTQFGPQPAENTDAQSTTSRQSEGSSKSRRRGRQDEPDEPPRFVVDLSLPPEQRYIAVCSAFQAEIAELVPLFDEVVGGILHAVPLKWLHRLCRLLLRAVYDKEENAELKGISKVTGVSMYLLVCFNVLLDLFMGCSSGGAAVRTADGGGKASKMLHFRTLDWGMPSLRRVVVQLDFVLEKDGPVFASSITYAGYVGVLTGVREGVSMSLNFRPNRVDNGEFWADAKYVWHHLCVLLGWRRSISSILRGYLLPRRKKQGWMSFGKAKQGSKEDLLDYAGILREIGGEEGGKKPITTTACYLCFCNGNETTIIEKDRISAKCRSGDEFIVVTNTDESPPSSPSPLQPADEKPTADATTTPTKAEEFEEIIAEAQDRQECAFHNWRNMQSSRARKQGLQHITCEDRKRLASVDEVVEIVQMYPTTNECTHFAAVLDPSEGEGKVVWCRRWKQPVGARWIRAHMSRTW